MKRLIISTGLVGILFMFSGCISSFEKSVHDDLKIPHVYIPPNNAYHPFTLLQYTKKGGFQQICDATTITGLTSQEIEVKKTKNNISNLEVKKNHKVTYNINISKDEIGNADVKYTDIKKVELSFENGKQVSIPVHISDVYNNIESSKCKNDIKIFASEIPNSEFYIPTVVFSYDIKYRVIDKNGIDITVELSKELSKIVLGKIGINYEGNKDLSMSGKNLYIGFRGIPKKVSLLNTSHGFNEEKASNGFKSMQFISHEIKEEDFSKNTILDVTDIVRKINNE